MNFINYIINKNNFHLYNFDNARINLSDSTKLIVFYLNTVPVACDRSRVLATVRHLEWRAGRFFGTRPLDRSFRYYFQSLPIQLEKHERLIQLGEWAAYAPLEKGADYKSNEIREICQKAVSEMSCSFLRRFKHSKGGEQ